MEGFQWPGCDFSSQQLYSCHSQSNGSENPERFRLEIYKEKMLKLFNISILVFGNNKDITIENIIFWTISKHCFKHELILSLFYLFETKGYVVGLLHYCKKKMLWRTQEINFWPLGKTSIKTIFRKLFFLWFINLQINISIFFTRIDVDDVIVFIVLSFQRIFVDQSQVNFCQGFQTESQRKLFHVHQCWILEKMFFTIFNITRNKRTCFFV